MTPPQNSPEKANAWHMLEMDGSGKLQMKCEEQQSTTAKSYDKKMLRKARDV